MLFNSITFLYFLPVVFILYWFVFQRDLRVQNLFLLAASYVFYGWWDWRFLLLLIFSTALDFFSGLKISRTKGRSRRKFWLILSMSVNLAFLGFFKYCNFFIDSWISLFSSFGVEMDRWTLQIILPVGISFYTFHGLSYVIDIYRKRIEPSRNWVNYSLFVSYFPLLVAGPIERATHLLPQIERPRFFSNTQAIKGVRLIIFGMLKKIVIADNLKPVVNELFADPSQHTGGTLIFGAALFSLQIYGDFSGYSDIARGVSKLFGIELLVNFKQPYLSRSIPEFWRRWHISLSSWFRDYIYIPLGGSRTSMAKAIRNVFVIFIVSGFWHGANWTFIIWGAIHAFLFIPSFIRKAHRNALGDEFETGSWYPSPRELTGILVTFALVTLAWVFFRADSISQAFSYLGYMADQPLRFNFSMFRQVILLLPFSFMLDILQRNDYLLQKKRTWYIAMESAVLVAIILVFGNFGGSEFIYFQF